MEIGTVQMTGPQFAPEPETGWRRLVAPAAIFLGFVTLILWLASDLRDWAFSWLQPALDWSREQNNASVVQAGAAILQAIAAVILIGLTWHSTKTSREMADRARRQAAAADSRARYAETQAGRAAERQAKISTMPVVIFRDPESQQSLIRKVSFKITNVGQGPALFTRVEIVESVVDFKLNRAGDAITLRVGEEAELELTIDEMEETGWVLGDQQPDDRGRQPLVTLTARCQDVRGETWESDAWIVWDAIRQEVRLGNASYSFPA
jgi:hypothetical protein